MKGQLPPDLILFIHHPHLGWALEKTEHSVKPLQGNLTPGFDVNASASLLAYLSFEFIIEPTHFTLLDLPGPSLCLAAELSDKLPEPPTRQGSRDIDWVGHDSLNRVQGIDKPTARAAIRCIQSKRDF